MEFATHKRMGLKVGRAWAIKEMLRELWRDVYPESALKLWKRLVLLGPPQPAESDSGRGNGQPAIANIMTYFQHGVTHAMSERSDSKIQTITQWEAWLRTKNELAAESLLEAFDALLTRQGFTLATLFARRSCRPTRSRACAH